MKRATKAHDFQPNNESERLGDIRLEYIAWTYPPVAVTAIYEEAVGEGYDFTD